MPTLHCQCPGDTHEPHLISCDFADKWRVIIFWHRRECILIYRDDEKGKDVSVASVRENPFLAFEDAIELARCVRDALNGRGWKRGMVSEEKKQEEREKISRWIKLKGSSA
jgi:hypothetical protein